MVLHLTLIAQKRASQESAHSHQFKLVMFNEQVLTRAGESARSRTSAKKVVVRRKMKRTVTSRKR